MERVPIFAYLNEEMRDFLFSLLFSDGVCSLDRVGGSIKR